MSLQIRHGKDLINPEKFRMKVLIYGLPGTGKSSWVQTADTPKGSLGIGACETGQGKGTLSIAQHDPEYVEPANLGELEAFCNGAVFRDKQVVSLDSLSYMVKSFIKDAALAIPRKQGVSEKRAQGVPELDDYGVMAEITRRLIAKLLERDSQHFICTATEKDTQPDEHGNALYVPDLPGALALTCTAMFDFVFRLRTRQCFRDKRDPSSRYVERYFITQPNGINTLAKCRSNQKGIPLLAPEVVFDLATGAGSFPDMLKTILKGYEVTK